MGLVPSSGNRLRIPFIHTCDQHALSTSRLSARQVLIDAEIVQVKSYFTSPVSRAGSDGRCNTIWYKADFKGGVYEARETVRAFGGAEERRVASLEGRA